MSLVCNLCVERYVGGELKPIGVLISPETTCAVCGKELTDVRHSWKVHGEQLELAKAARAADIARKVVVFVTLVATGETRSFAGDWAYWAGGDGSDYIWSEGNYACDCNRALFFSRAGAEPDAETAPRPCSDGKYRVRVEVDGKTVYEDR